MEKFSKFIIEGNALILQKVTFHKEMVNDASQVKGGGWFFYESDTNTFILSKESHDFGKAKLEDIKTCIENGEVYSCKYKRRNMSKRHNFSYDTGTEIIEIQKLTP